AIPEVIADIERMQPRSLVQTLLRSATSVANDAGSTVDGTVPTSWAAILASISATRASALFHRASSSPVTNRLAGSAASYCRKARIGCIARRFEITPERLTHLVPWLPRLLLGSNGCRNSARANDSEKGTLNGVIHPQPAKSDATRLAIVHPAAGAAVARDVMLRS